jgi:hypothetical protein
MAGQGQNYTAKSHKTKYLKVPSILNLYARKFEMTKDGGDVAWAMACLLP